MAYILALDQGTTSSRGILFDEMGKKRAVAQREFGQIYPRAAWVEHDPAEIWESQVAVARDVLKRAEVDAGQVNCLGITNQRETTIVWDRETGEPVYNAIVWQCRRTADYCQQLKETKGDLIQGKTGLVVDAYFSASKIRWILEQVAGARDRAEAGDLCFGTVDSWLLYKLTGGKVHATDYSNASRTMLFNIHSLEWDDELLALFDIPRAMLPEVKPSGSQFGMVSKAVLGASIPVSGILGDQQAALFGHRCFGKGEAKNTYGTGCFMLMNTGHEAYPSDRGLLTTIGWGREGADVVYALEGSVFIAGAAVQWLRDELKVIEDSGDTEALALSLAGNEGVYFVPAFAGLGAPYWDMYARGTLVGLTRGTGRAHLARAALEAIAYQTKDVLLAMERDADLQLEVLRVDGGAAANGFLMQFQADMLGCQVNRPEELEVTARGAGFMAGLTSGVWHSLEEILALDARAVTFDPKLAAAEVDRHYRGWKEAVRRASGWEMGPEKPY